MENNIQDDINALKQAVKQNGFIIERIEKMGNGSMPFYKMMYYRPNDTTLKSYHFNRHEIEGLINMMNQYSSKS